MPTTSHRLLHAPQLPNGRLACQALDLAYLDSITR
jgi:hypothetical protein